jgi:hypothetical protein
MPDVARFGDVRVSGLGDAARALRRAGVDAGDLRDVVYDVGMIVVNAADIAVQTGALKDSLRAGRGKQKAVVRAGGGSVAHAAAYEYGFAARNYPASFALNQARDENLGEIVDRLEAGIEDVLHRAGLL